MNEEEAIYDRYLNNIGRLPDLAVNEHWKGIQNRLEANLFKEDSEELDKENKNTEGKKSPQHRSTVLPYLKKSLGLLFFFLASISFASAQNNVDLITTENGLSSSSVRCIFQDHKGFMWFGTYDGLNRYDGFTFKVFRHRDKDTSSIVHNWINTITESADRKLWIGTRQGIGIYNPVTDDFASARYRRAGESGSRPLNGFIRTILRDGKNNMYAAVQDLGLVRFKVNSSVGELVNYQDPEKEPTYNVASMCVVNGYLWVIVGSRGLQRFNDTSGKFEPISKALPTAQVMLAEGNLIWAANAEGIFMFDTRSKKRQTVLDAKLGTLSSSRVTGFLRNGPNQLWIGTDGGGINCYDLSTKTMTYLRAANTTPTLGSDAVHALYQDRTNRKWIGTLRGGVNVIEPAKKTFQLIAHQPEKNSLVNNFVLSLFEEPSGKLWIGTDGGGFSIWDRKSGRFTNFSRQQGRPSAIGSDFITSIKSDYTGTIWLSTYEGGISKYDHNNGSFKQYLGHDPVASVKKNATFWFIFEDKQRNLWASGLHNGLYLYHRAADKFVQFDRNLKNLLAMTQDKKGRIWGGTFDGLLQIDPAKRRHVFTSIDRPVRSIFEDSKSRLWVGTEGGLLLFDGNRHKVIKKFTTQDGLPSDYILTIQEDEQGYLWMSTYNGLARFHPDQQTFKRFGRSEGVQKEFNYMAALRLRSGEMAFGGLKGLTLFQPNQINGEKKDPVLSFTGLKIDEQPIQFFKSLISSSTADQITKIEVPYEQAIFTFEYTAIAYPTAEQTNFRYKMDGWDRGWIDAGAVRVANYTHLSPGKYVFRVKSTNTTGAWTARELTMDVVVLPPWYSTWWAWTTYSLAFFGLIFVYVNYRFKKRELEYKVGLAHAEAEKQQEIHEKRLEFFTSISHEFRTPLSLIINPVKDLLDRLELADHKELHIVHRNARRLLSLVDQLLLFRKAESGLSLLKITKINLAKLCEDVYLSFSQHAKTAGVRFELQGADSDVIVFGDREKLEIVLFNLVSNAIKFTPPSGTIVLGIKHMENYLEVYVSDTGSGISPEVGERIFDKFYQARSAGKPTRAGFGIGLYLARQFANDHHGSLAYTSEIGHGTIFHLKLLLGTAHFPELVITPTEEEDTIFLNELVTATSEVKYSETSENNFSAADIFSDQPTLLVIDDDLEMRKYIKDIFVGDYVVTEAPDAETAMILVKKDIPDLVISDVMMPGMNGIEWCAWLKQDPSLGHIPVILLTGSSSSGNKLRGLGCGADDYISKPFEKELLKVKVANLLKARNNLRNYFYNEITLQTQAITVSEDYKLFLDKCRMIVENHLKDPNFSSKTLSDQLGMSRSNLYRKVRSLSGYNISNFIRFIRLRKAAELLVHSELNVNEVAMETGFNNIKYFRKQFVELFKMTPSEFLKQNRVAFGKRFKMKTRGTA